MRILSICIIGIVAYICQTNASRVILQRFTTNNGIHRDITTTVTFSTDFFNNRPEPTQCKCLLLQTLPAAVYVDPFQLTQYFKNNDPKFISPGVDIEKPEYLSAPLKVILFTDLLSSDDGEWIANITLPVHIRYHRSTVNPDEDYKNITITDPDIFLKCSDINRLSDDEEISLPCDETNTDHCMWTKIHSKSATATVHFDVPIGKNNHLLLVLCGTLITSLFGCIFVIHSIAQSDKL